MMLSVLDQSPVIAGQSGAAAIADTMTLVESADRWGYHRYWFSEHHGSASFASASPLVMMAHAAARTTRIRLGSGGVLMGHARPLEVAEAVRVLHALAPGRIDLGMGRAPGGDQRVMQALGYDPRTTPQRIREVLDLLADTCVASNDGRVVAVPDGVPAPEPWVLGTSPDSAQMAAALGLPYAAGAFIDPTQIEACLATYYQHFVPSRWCAAPTTMLATVVFCADTEQDARRIMHTSEQWFVQSFLRGENVRFPAGDHSITLSARETMITEMRRSTVIWGTAQACVEQLQMLQKRLQVAEVAVVTITERFDDRLRSYELLAEALQ